MENSAVDLSPFMRALVVAAMVLLPILVIILQRLPALRDIARRRKNGELPSFDGSSLLTFGGHNDVSICSKCYRINPPDQQFCGFCGAKTNYHKKGT